MPELIEIRTRTDEAHLATKHVRKLRKFVELRLAQPFPNSGNARISITRDAGPVVAHVEVDVVVAVEVAGVDESVRVAVALVRVGDQRAVVIGVGDAVVVGVEVARVADPVAIAVELVRVRDDRAVSPCTAS